MSRAEGPPELLSYADLIHDGVARAGIDCFAHQADVADLDERREAHAPLTTG